MEKWYQKECTVFWTNSSYWKIKTDVRGHKNRKWRTNELKSEGVWCTRLKVIYGGFTGLLLLSEHGPVVWKRTEPKEYTENQRDGSNDGYLDRLQTVHFPKKQQQKK